MLADTGGRPESGPALRAEPGPAPPGLPAGFPLRPPGMPAMLPPSFDGALCRGAASPLSAGPAGGPPPSGADLPFAGAFWLHIPEQRRALLCVPHVKGAPCAELLSQASQLCAPPPGQSLTIEDRYSCSDAGVRQALWGVALPDGFRDGCWAWATYGGCWDGVGIASNKKERLRAAKLALAACCCLSTSPAPTWRPASFRRFVDHARHLGERAGILPAGSQDAPEVGRETTAAAAGAVTDLKVKDEVELESMRGRQRGLAPALEGAAYGARSS